MMRKKKSQMLPIIKTVLCSHKTFTFSNSLVIIHSQAKLFLKLTRDCSLIKDWHFLRCVVSSNTFACICWLDVGFPEAPQAIHVFFTKKKLSRVSRVPFIGKDFPCFVILGPCCLKGAWLSGVWCLVLWSWIAGCFLRESQGREYTGARRQKLSKYWSLMMCQTMFDWLQWKHLSLWWCVEKTLYIHIQQMKLMSLCLFCMFEKATYFFLFLLVFLHH